MGKLAELAEKYGTDKNLNDHGYVSVYERWFNESNVNSLLEIGLGNGASARMWLEYLSNAKIYAMEYFEEENKEKWNSFDGSIEGLNLVRGNSTVSETWNSVPSELDIIIDDGSHQPEDQIATFNLGFNKLRSHGLWIIEDTHCGFHSLYGAKPTLYQWLINLIVDQQVPHLNTDGNFYRNRQFMSGAAKDIYGYFIFKSLIILEKA